jgi:hypothetical protein
VRLLIGLLFTFAFAAASGLAATWDVTARGAPMLGGLRVCAWIALPKAGTADIDPFARAIVARNGSLPLGSGDGISFLARADDAGKALDGRCDVTVSGTTPLARYWTLTLYNPDGGLVANAVGRYGFTSREILRRADGSFEIVIAPRARAGNWLPTGGVGRYVLALRLYDTPVGLGTRARSDVVMPAISGGACQ